jgi:SNF2 family DNA or RNA helicase
MGAGSEPAGLFFQNFFWRRVIFDEQHELVGLSAYTTNLLNSLHGEVHWGMSGTPLLLPRTRSGDGLQALNHVFHFDGTDSTLFSGTRGLTHAVVEAAVRRTPLQAPPLEPIQVHRHTVALSDWEHQMAESHAGESDAVLVQLVTCYNVLALLGQEDTNGDDALGSMTFPELAKLMVGKHDAEIQRESQRLQQFEADVVRDTALLEQARQAPERRRVRRAEEEQEEDSSLARFLLRQLRTNQRNVDACRAKVQSLQCQRNFFHTQVAEQARECPICMESRASVITKCGHWFCASCVRAYKRERKHVCPVCKTAIQNDEWVVVTSAEQPKPEPEVVHASKLAAIAALLREVTGRREKVVMFVQWTALMRAMRGVLRTMGIEALLVHGNSSTRNAAIEKMQTGKADVLILSLETSTSGLNLIEANHVIFAHAMVDTTASREASIKQAISRVHRLGQTKQVHVHWFIAERSREADIFDTTS